MAIKEVPTNIRQYFALMRSKTKEDKEAAEELLETLKDEIKSLKKEFESKIQEFDVLYKINLIDYDEFINNEYTNGQFLKMTKSKLVNSKDNYKLIQDLYDLYTFAEKQKTIFDTKKKIEFYNKLLAVKITEYREILRRYYTEVHKKLILEGYGYSLGKIGWFCVNRCLVRRRKKMLDFAATKKREKELKEKGIRIFNKAEADWCKKNGIEYKAEDKRVFKNDEYYYEIPLIACKLTGGHHMILTISDYRASEVRGMTHEEILEKCNNDPKKICELPLDVKTKLTLCDKVDKILYTKFIRNENQERYIVAQTRRKD